MSPNNITIEELSRKYDQVIQEIKQLKSENKQLKNENRKLVQENIKLREYIRHLESKVEKQNKIIEKQNKIIQKLQKKLRKYKNENTPSGSLPPYLKDELYKMTKEDKKPKSNSDERRMNIRNKREYDRVEEHELKVCPFCGGPLKKRQKTRKRIIIHLEMPKSESVLHESPVYFCKKCNKEVEPIISDALPNSKYDLNTHLFILMLSVLGLTQRKISEMLILFGINMPSSSVNNAIHRVERYLGKKKYNELKEELKKSVSTCTDETSWRHKGKTFWTWVVTNAKSVFYKIEKSRGTTVAKKIPTGKIITCDGYRPYDSLNKPIQRCWAHMLRKARNPDYFNEEWEIEQYKAFVEGLVEIYKDAKRVKERSKEIKKKFEERFRKYLLMPRKEEKNLRRLINYIVRYEGDWFTFLEYEDVEPTNNRAERMLRPLVIKRKISQHTWSKQGREGLAVVYSLYETAKLRNENFIDMIRNEIKDNILEKEKS